MGSPESRGDMSENEKPTQKQPAESQESAEELSEQSLAEVSGGVIAIIRPNNLEQDGQAAGLISSYGLETDAIHFKYDIKGNKEG